jgi:hypothetical protein
MITKTQRVTKDTKGTTDHMVSQSYIKSYPTIPFPNHLIEKGSQTACNRELGYHYSCTLCKCSALYPRVVISSLIVWLENLLFAILYTSFGVWPRDHCMPLQRLTLVRMSCFALGSPCWISHNTLRPLSQLLRFPLVGYHTISLGPSCTLRPCRYHHTSTAHPTRQTH